MVRPVSSAPVIIPNPDPSSVTSDAIDRRVDNIEKVLATRIDGMQKAVEVFQQDLTRVPTQLDRAIAGLHDLLTAKIAQFDHDLLSLKELSAAQRQGIADTLEQRLDGMDKAIDLFQKFTDKQPDFVRDQVMHLRELHNTRFEGVTTQFTLLKQATEQLDLANKTAIAAALQAQKESAGETQKSSQAAIAKSENSTSEAIKALTATFSTAMTAMTDRFNDLKSRLDRGEGKVSVSDPAVDAKLSALVESVKSLSASRDQSSGREKISTDSSARMMAMVAIAAAVAIGVAEIVTRIAVH